MAQQVFVSAEDVAEYFLSLVDEESGDNISNLKLQKLLYYAQGFHLAVHGRPLFFEKIKAWAHGPVVPQVYQKYKEYGAGAIPLPKDMDYSKISDEAKSLLNEIYKVFGQYSAWKLREMTHDEPPWKNAEQSAEISHRTLKDYFKRRISNG